MHLIEEIIQKNKWGLAAGVYSACSANDYVLRAVLCKAKETGTCALIEATANQVNQTGGYTGLTPDAFFKRVIELAGEIGMAPSRVILGGDHLGPLTWRNLPEKRAMENAEALVRAYAMAGFTKLHLDTSMALADDDPDVRLSDETIARRGAALCAAAEAAYAERKRIWPDAQPPVYVIGSEVPIPGGAQEAEEGVSVTDPQACRHTIRAFEKAFIEQGLEKAWARVVAIVVQPGVEFGDDMVFGYDHGAATGLLSVLAQTRLVFEGHSTDYQTKYALRQMVKDGICILKVGPALTFAMREGLLALESMEKILLRGAGVWMSDFAATLERAMLEAPAHWARHYHGDGVQLAIKRVFSYSDRARYYLPDSRVNASIERLMENLNGAIIPPMLLSQFMPMQYRKVCAGSLQCDARSLLLDRIGDCIDDYLYATCADAGEEGREGA